MTWSEAIEEAVNALNRGDTMVAMEYRLLAVEIRAGLDVGLQTANG